MTENPKPDFEISYLIARRISGCITPEEDRRLEAWLADGPNRALFEKIASDEAMSRKIARYRDEDVPAAFGAFAARRARAARRTVRLRRWVAAAVVIPLLATGYLLFREGSGNFPGEQTELIAGRGVPTLTLSTGEQMALGDSDVVVTDEGGAVISVTGQGAIDYSAVEVSADRVIYNKLETPVACDYHFILSDGTKVWMNAMSSLRYPVIFDPQERVLEASGEIYLEVEPDPRRPFYVIAGGARIEVTGTAFNVHSYPDEEYMEVTLAEGKVRVHAGGGRYELTPGRQLHWNVAGGEPEVRQVNVADYTSWKDGMYVFKSRPLGEAMKVAERWYDIEVSFEAPGAATSVYTGVLMKDDSLEEFLRRLEKTSSYTFRRSGRSITVR